MAERRAARWVLRACVVFSGVLVGMLAVWVASDPVVNLTTDWTAFDNAADRIVSGETIYRPYDSDAEPLPYLYPPTALWLSLPLAVVGFGPSWVLSAVFVAAAWVLGLRSLRGAQPSGTDDFGSMPVTIAAVSGLGVSATLIGQYSGLWVWAIGFACVSFARGRQGRAGIALALLTLKPNLGIAIPIVLIWSRSWRALGGFVGGAVALVLSSAVFGRHQWQGFADNVEMMADLQAEGIVPFDKMVTIQGVLQERTGWGTTDVGFVLLWGAFALLSGLVVLAAWRPERLARDPLRAFGVLAVFVVVANLRLYFYDGALAIAGGLALASSPTVRTGTYARRLLWPLLAVLWVASWGGIWLSLNTVLAVGGALLLLVVGADLIGATGPSEPGNASPENRPTGTDRPISSAPLGAVSTHNNGPTSRSEHKENPLT